MSYLTWWSRCSFSSRYQTGQHAPDGTGVVWGLFTCSWLSSSASVSSFAECTFWSSTYVAFGYQPLPQTIFSYLWRDVLPQSSLSFCNLFAPLFPFSWQAVDESLSTDAIEKPQIMLHLFLLSAIKLKKKKINLKKHSKHWCWMTVLFLMVIMEIIIHHFGNKNLSRRTVDSKSPFFFFFAENVLLLLEPKRPKGEQMPQFFKWRQM